MGPGVLVVLGAMAEMMWAWRWHLLAFVFLVAFVN